MDVRRKNNATLNRNNGCFAKKQLQLWLSGICFKRSFKELIIMMLTDLIQFLPITLIAAALLFFVKVTNRGDRVHLNIKKQELVNELVSSGLSEQQAESAAKSLAALSKKNANIGNNSTSMPFGSDTNPATGLIMVGGVDTAGNVYGSSSQSNDRWHY
jgi:hypothetical protein